MFTVHKDAILVYYHRWVSKSILVFIKKTKGFIPDMDVWMLYTPFLNNSQSLC